METEDNKCDPCSNTEIYPYVVEMVENVSIDDFWFLYKHQYLHVRSELLPLDIRFENGFDKCVHHIVYVPSEDKEYAIPEHVGILTDEYKSEIAQDTLLYLEKKYNSGVKDYWTAYKNSLPIGETDESFGKAEYTLTWYKDFLKQKLEG